MKPITKSVGVISAALMLPFAAHSETLRYSTAGPPTHPGTSSMQEMADRLSEATGGELGMEVFSLNQLGDETEIIKQVARGRVDMGGFSVTAAATAVPEVTVMISPYFWSSAEQAACALNSGLGQALEPYFEAKGLKVLQWQNIGWQVFFAKDAIVDPADVAGYKVRVSPAKNHEMFWKATGASGIPLPFAETATALQTGIVDGGELPTVSYIATGMGKLAPNLIKTNHVYQPLVQLMSVRSWDKLSADQQAAVQESLPNLEAVNEAVVQLDATLEKRHMKEGGQVFDLTPEQRAKWSALFTEEKQLDLIADIGGDAQAIYDAAVAARDSCAN